MNDRFGQFGGRYVPETLVAPLAALAAAYDEIRTQSSFQEELAYLLSEYVGRPTPLYRANRLGEAGGTGLTFPWELAQAAKAFGVPVFVAGGLTPDNVEEAVEKTQPFGVDVASGVEKTPKRKDYDTMKSFIVRAKA